MNTGNGENDGEIIFPFQPFLDDIEMKESEKTAAKTLTQGSGGVLLINEGSVIELIFFEGDSQIFIVIRGDGVNGREDDRFEFPESGKRLRHRGVDRG